MDILLAALAAAAFLAAVALLLLRLAGLAGKRRAASEAAPRKGVAGSARTCPLCSSIMAPGERVTSTLYPGKGDRIMHIFGCPRCWPADPSSRATPPARRTCPVCGREIGREGWATARYFDRAAGKGGGSRAHVHVLGCTECRG